MTTRPQFARPDTRTRTDAPTGPTVVPTTAPDRTVGGRVVALRRPVPFAPVQGTLALDLGIEESLRTELVDARPAPVITLTDLEGGEAMRRLQRDGERWARRYLQAAVEIAGGARPSSQLLRWTTRDVHADLDRRGQLVARAAGRHPGEHGRAALAPTIMSLHPHTVRRGVLEVAARVRYGERCRAVAARFELRQERWVCTALEFA